MANVAAMSIAAAAARSDLRGRDDPGLSPYAHTDALPARRRTTGGIPLARGPSRGWAVGRRGLDQFVTRGLWVRLPPSASLSAHDSPAVLAVHACRVTPVTARSTTPAWSSCAATIQPSWPSRPCGSVDASTEDKQMADRTHVRSRLADDPPPPEDHPSVIRVASPRRIPSSGA